MSAAGVIFALGGVFWGGVVCPLDKAPPLFSRGGVRGALLLTLSVLNEKNKSRDFRLCFKG